MTRKKVQAQLFKKLIIKFISYTFCLIQSHCIVCVDSYLSPDYFLVCSMFQTA